MRVSALNNSLERTGAGADWAMTVSASFVISDARSTASTFVIASSGASRLTNQRRTLRTISAWVSPSNVNVGITPNVRLWKDDAMEDAELVHRIGELVAEE